MLEPESDGSDEFQMMVEEVELSKTDVFLGDTQIFMKPSQGPSKAIYINEQESMSTMQSRFEVLDECSKAAVLCDGKPLKTGQTPWAQNIRKGTTLRLVGALRGGGKRAAASEVKQKTEGKAEKLARLRSELEASELLLRAGNHPVAAHLAEAARLTFGDLEPRAVMNNVLAARTSKQLKAVRDNMETSNNEASRIAALARGMLLPQMEALEDQIKNLKNAEAWMVGKCYIAFIELYQEDGFISWKTFKAALGEALQRKRATTWERSNFPGPRKLSVWKVPEGVPEGVSRGLGNRRFPEPGSS